MERNFYFERAALDQFMGVLIFNIIDILNLDLFFYLEFVIYNSVLF